MSANVLTFRTEGQRILEYARSQDLDVHILGVAPPIKEVVRLNNNWMLVPAVEDMSIVPAEGLRRLNELHAEGFRFKDFVVAHETPKLPGWRHFDFQPA